MRPRHLVLLVIMTTWTAALVVAQPATPAASLEEGIRQYEQAEFLRAIVTLDQVVQSLKGDERNAATLSQALLYLGMSHLALDQESAARMRFRAAIKYMLIDARAQGKAESAADLMLDASLYSPKVIDLFEAAKAEALSATEAEKPAKAPGPTERRAVSRTTRYAPRANATQIRFRTRTAPWVEARLLRLGRSDDGQQVLDLLSPLGSGYSIPLSSVVEMQSHARKRRTLQGLAIGVGVGLAMGFAMSVDPNDCGQDSTNFCSRGQALTGSVIAMGGSGALVGALIHRDSWKRMPLAQLSVGAGPPGSRALAAQLAWRF